jgi:hypothetical protein
MDKTKETPTSYPSIKIDKDMKLRLLKACAAGEINPEDFPELFAITPRSLRFLTDDQLDAQIKEYERKNRMIGWKPL